MGPPLDIDQGRFNAFAPDQPVKRQRIKTLNILVVDDNLPSAQTMAWTMEAEGHHVEVAQDAASTLELIDTFVPDVILLDIGLPGMNGYKLCQMLREKPALKSTLFIAQTGWGQKEDQLQSKQAGFDHHLIKPIDWKELQRILNSFEK